MKFGYVNRKLERNLGKRQIHNSTDTRWEGEGKYQNELLKDRTMFVEENLNLNNYLRIFKNSQKRDNLKFVSYKNYLMKNVLRKKIEEGKMGYMCMMF